MSKSINWLVIGIGDITRRRVMPAILAEPRSHLRAVVTRDPSKAAGYTGVDVYDSLPDALRDPAIDAVYVASPVFLHAEQTLASLRAGKHVLCEKPMAMNLPEAQQMVDAARDGDRLLGVAYYRRLYPKLLRARELIASGAIGTAVLVEANCHGWLDAEDGHWLRDPARAGGGPLYDVGSHRIDACNFLFGQPLRAAGFLSAAVHGLAVEDAATVIITYAGGVHAVVDVRWNSHVARDQFRVVGTEGEINLDPLSGPVLGVSCGGARAEERLPPHANAHYPIVHDFVNAVLDGTPLACRGDAAVWTDWVTAQVMRAR